jgi:hypothetical protein
MAEAAGSDEGDARALCPLGRSAASPRAWPSTWSIATRRSRPRWKPFVLPKTSKEMLISRSINMQGKTAHPGFSQSTNFRETTVEVAKKSNIVIPGEARNLSFLGLDPGEIPRFARNDSQPCVFAACGYAIPHSVTGPQPPRPDTPAA